MNCHQIKQGRILLTALVSNLSFGGLHELIASFLEIDNREGYPLMIYRTIILKQRRTLLKYT